MALLWAFPAGLSHAVLKNLLSCGGVVGNKWLMNPFELSTFVQWPVICRGLALVMKVIPSNPMLLLRAKFLFLLSTKYSLH